MLEDNIWPHWLEISAACSGVLSSSCVDLQWVSCSSFQKGISDSAVARLLPMGQLFSLFSSCECQKVGASPPPPRISRCAPSCVLMSSPPPVRPCWVSLYHPSTLLSHHVGRTKKGQNASLINTILTRGRQRQNTMGVSFSRLYGGWAVRDALKDSRAIIFNYCFSVSAFCSTENKY